LPLHIHLKVILITLFSGRRWFSKNPPESKADKIAALTAELAIKRARNADLLQEAAEEKERYVVEKRVEREKYLAEMEREKLEYMVEKERERGEYMAAMGAKREEYVLRIERERKREEGKYIAEITEKNVAIARLEERLAAKVAVIEELNRQMAKPKDKTVA
jgi:hypothetical protein